MATQLYLGSPNAVVLCINEFIPDEGQSHIRGVMYHSYQEEGTPFENLDEMTMHMEFSRDLNSLANKIGKAGDKLGDIKVKAMEQG